MSKPRAVIWFAGAGLSSIGITAAGFDVVHAVEWDPKIAKMYRDNLGDHIEVADVRDVDVEPWKGIDLFQASPVCTNASVANTKGEESTLDIECAEAVARFIRVCEPRNVIIENVWPYRAFRSCAIIMAALDAVGYMSDMVHVNFSDYGVPQSRCRMIVRAKLDGLLPCYPVKRPEVGWYEAIEDLVPDLEECSLAPWQLARFEKNPESLMNLLGVGMLIEGSVGGDRAPRAIGPDEPSMVIRTDSGGSVHRAVLVEGWNPGREMSGRHGDESATTITATVCHRAILVGTNDTPDGTITMCGMEKPAQSVTAQAAGSRKAILVRSTNSNSNGTLLLDDVDGAFTVDLAAMPKAILVEGAPCSSNFRPMALRSQDERVHCALIATPGGFGGEPRLVPTSEPCPTLRAGSDGLRMMLDGMRIVKITERCCARWQTVPDWYKLTGKKGLDIKAIGNGVPCKGIEMIARTLLQ